MKTEKMENQKVRITSVNLMSIALAGLWSQLILLSELFNNMYSLFTYSGWIALAISILLFFYSLKNIIQLRKVNKLFIINTLLLIFPMYLLCELFIAYITFRRLY